MKIEKAIIGIETLVDPLNLSIALVYLLKIKNIRIFISNIDFLELQSLNGGILPDDNGVLSIDSIIKYAWDQIDSNNREPAIRKATETKNSILSPNASFSMIFNLIEQGYIELVDEELGTIVDGMCFLLTEDVNKWDTESSSFKKKIYSKYGFAGDVLNRTSIRKLMSKRYNHKMEDIKFFKKKYPHLPLNLITPMASDFRLRSSLMWSRLQTVGISAKSNIPIFNSDKKFQKQLDKYIKRRNLRINREIYGIQENAKIDFRKYTIRDLIKVININDQQIKFLDALYRADERFKLKREKKEDFLTLLLDLSFGQIPFVGTGFSIFGYLYKKKKRDSRLRNLD